MVAAEPATVAGNGPPPLAPPELAAVSAVARSSGPEVPEAGKLPMNEELRVRSNGIRIRPGDLGLTPFWNCGPAGPGVMLLTPTASANAPVKAPTPMPRFSNACWLRPSIWTQNAEETSPPW